MRKISDQFVKQSPVLELSKGRWAQYRKIQNYHGRLQKFAGQLYLQDNNEPKILLQIVDLKFENLIKLSLQDNNIESIESISQLYCPKLVQLQLGDNKITTIKALRKTNFQNLKVLSLRKNKIAEMQPLQELYSIVRNVFIQWFDDYSYCSDLSWCLKMETFQLKQLVFQSKSRILQKKVLIAIQRRFHNAKINYYKFGYR